MRLRVRTWLHGEGWDGHGWPLACVRRFERLMALASRKPKGRPPLVLSWDDGRGVMCWYEAHAGLEERQLAAHCRKLFGARENGHVFENTPLS